MNFGQIARLLAAFLLFFSLFLLVPLSVAALEDDKGLDTASAFSIALAAGLAISALLWLAGTRSTKELFRRDGLAFVVLAWVFAAGIAAIPLKWAGATTTTADALFEAMSGMTTTGATVLGTGENKLIEDLPMSLLLWRAMLQWIGGIGIVLAFVVLLPAMGMTGSRLLASEQVGMADESHRPRMKTRARRIFMLYVSLTALACLGYGFAGMTWFDATCHALTTLATGGFSNNNISIAGYQSLSIEIVAIVFMFLAGMNFLFVLRMLIRGPLAKEPSLIHRIEFRAYCGITLSVVLIATISLWAWGGQILDTTTKVTHDYGEFGRCLRDATFQTISILTSTGYASVNFDGWPKVALYMLILCMFIGGCTGSTAGGFKILRIVVCAKLLGYALRQFVRPRSVETLKLGKTPISNAALMAILSLLLLWLVIVGAGTLILDLDPRLDMVSAFTASLSMVGCIGPAVSEVAPGSNALVSQVDLGPYSGYGYLDAGTKLFMSLQMLLGRLEILAPLVLLTPRFWKR